MHHAAYPALRLRRTRAAAWSRALVAETAVTPADLIWPIFVREGRGEEPIAAKGYFSPGLNLRSNNWRRRNTDEVRIWSTISPLSRMLGKL